MATRSGSAPPGLPKAVLEDEDYFMTVACVTAMRSKDPSTQVGACIVKDGNIVSLGYNDIPVDKKGKIWQSPDKNLFVSFAVTHAITNARPEDLKGATVYTTLFPSNRCAISMIQSGIVKLVYATTNPKHTGQPWLKASKDMLNLKGIQDVHFAPTISAQININLDTTNEQPV